MLLVSSWSVLFINCWNVVCGVGVFNTCPVSLCVVQMTVQACQNQNIKFLIFWNRRTLDLLPYLPLCSDFGQQCLIVLSKLLSSDVVMVMPTCGVLL